MIAKLRDTNFQPQDTKPVRKLILGTAQFGLQYGLANKHGQPDNTQVNNMLNLAYESGIRIVDTAAAYGESERVLGGCDMKRWSVITKVPSLNKIDDYDIEKNVRESVLRSLELLGIDKLHAVLAHDSRDMVGDRGKRFYATLKPMLDDGLIDRIGVSVYTPENTVEIEADCAQVVQAPLNVFDQRFTSSGKAATLRENGGELHVRSIFLQGLLLMPASQRPSRFARWAPILARYDEQVLDSGLDPAAFCLGFVVQKADVTHCVVGVDTVEQLSGLVRAFDAGQKVEIKASDLETSELGLIDPRCWEEEK